MRQVSKLYGKASALEGNVAVSMKAAAKTAAGVKSATTTSAGTMASQTAISQKERKQQDRKREREKEKQIQQQQLVAGRRQAPEHEESSPETEHFVISQSTDYLKFDIFEASFYANCNSDLVQN